MTGSPPLPSVDSLKEEARRMRAEHAANGSSISHGRALELLAEVYGFKDWNTLRAASENHATRPPLGVGDKVRGVYLGQPFIGSVLDLKPVTPPGRFRVTLHFAAPVDVVTFDSFSNLRQRVVCTIDRTGKSAETTSDGRPQIHVERHPE